MLLSLLKTFLVLIVGVFSGYLFKKWINKNKRFSDEFLKKLAIFLQKLGMIWLISVTYIGSVWILEMENITKIFSLPLVGAVSILSGGALALLLAKLYHYNPIDTGSLFSCGFFSNIVSLGGMVCFFYLGERGYALVPIYTFLSRLLYFGLGYPVARIYSNDFDKGENIIKKLLGIIKDPFFM